MCSKRCVFGHLGEVLYGSVQTSLGLFDGSHVLIDGADLAWPLPALQLLQGALTLPQSLVRSPLALEHPAGPAGTIIRLCCQRLQHCRHSMLELVGPNMYYGRGLQPWSSDNPLSYMF